MQVSQRLELQQGEGTVRVSLGFAPGRGRALKGLGQAEGDTEWARLVEKAQEGEVLEEMSHTHTPTG